MYSFKNDYSEGAHKRILDAMIKSNMEQTDGYGTDDYCLKAAEYIKNKMDYNDADVHFLVGGTQTNLTAISSFLKPYEAAIAVSTGHINTHETGAIEATGHKVISAADTYDGKLQACHIEKVLAEHTDEHMVKPKLVYISNPTEIGTIYSKSELKSLSDCCRKHNLFLYLDGARLASALCADGNDIALSDYPRLCDAFYIGGTKCGALMGEALVICNNSLKEDFRYNIKNKGALFAKGRLLGIQFLELFKDNLYFELGDFSNKMAKKLKDGITKAGYKFMIDSDTNQIFPIFPNDIVKKISNNYNYTLWKKEDENNSVLRLVTSWATDETEVENFIEFLNNL
ncbi:threonine aldolase family protein [Inconstantimicrobium porci]|uniref:Low specificity L-threonine aldolase n=1 Tax=Inconstantimicrobium porci TaxID=2652291 RepID=A0A7X2MWX4_9CLOT|nr:low specificity L-threonine aldolase [Inconstantimicrobium porci]MSR90577.1 low specificity L-threonine aldolase [Inconstantimicrobium porci]